MFAQLLLLLADAPQGGGGTPPGAPANNDPFGGLGMLVPMLGVFLVGYLLLFRPLTRNGYRCP